MEVNAPIDMILLRKRYIWLMRTSCDVIGHILVNITQADASTFRDGEDGWTVLEVLGHLRDFDTIFRQRAEMIRDQQNPSLPAYDHEAMAIEGRYNQAELQLVYQELRASREATIAFFRSLEETDWERAGIHPEKGRFTMLDAAAQIGFHEMDHIEQITRILTQKKLP